MSWPFFGRWIVGFRFDDEVIREKVGAGSCVIAGDGRCDVMWWKSEGFSQMKSRLNRFGCARWRERPFELTYLMFAIPRIYSTIASTHVVMYPIVEH